LVKIISFLLCQAQTSVLATRAGVTLTFDWLALAVKLVLVGSCTWKIAQFSRYSCPPKHVLPQMPTNPMRALPVHASQRGYLCRTQEEKIDFYHRGN